VREGNSELIRTMDQISEMISYEPEHIALTSTTYFSLLKRLKSREFDIVFLLGKEFSFARSLIALLSRARLRVGFTQQYSYPFINCEIRPSSNGKVYEAPRAAGFLAALGMAPGDSLTGWKLPAQDIRWAEQMIHFRKPEKDTMLIAVDPGMGKANRRLVDKSLAYMVNRIGQHYPSRFLILSNNLDARGMEQFRSLVDVDRIDLEPKNVKEALALLSRADLVLAGNTDYFHFAVSMHLPTVGFFTRHDEANWVPRGTPWVQIIQGVKGQKLSLDEVFSKIDTLLHFSGE
jgi:ADP-heptose:LPS heptosyltransferase